MDNVTTLIQENKGHLSRRALRHVLNWFFLATLGFIIVIVAYQLLMGAMSFALGYTTCLHFGKVDSMPYFNSLWSNSRVLVMYAFPSVLFLFVSAFILAALLFAPKNEVKWRWIAFWVMFFSALLSTTLMSLSLISVLVANGALYQGFAVVSSWFRLSSAWSIGLITLSGFINIGMGFLCSSVLLRLAPPDFILRKEKKSPIGIIISSFIVPVVLMFPIAVLLSYPGHVLFFALMFCHACLWLPGLFTLSLAAVGQRRSRGITTPESHSIYVLTGITLSIIIVIRIFFI